MGDCRIQEVDESESGYIVFEQIYFMAAGFFVRFKKGPISQGIGPFYCYGSPGKTLSKTHLSTILAF